MKLAVEKNCQKIRSDEVDLFLDDKEAMSYIKSFLRK